MRKSALFAFWVFLGILSGSTREVHRSLPVSFEANQGIADPEVRFFARGGGYTLFLTPAAAVFQLADRSPAATLRMRLSGANPAPRLEGLKLLESRSHYLVGNDPRRWSIGAPHYGRVRYRRVYPGIDLVFYGNGRRIEYDFVVGPGADPGRIRLQFDGIGSARVDHGELVLGAAAGEFRQHRPRVYQETAGGRREIPTRYVVYEGGAVGFQVERYDASRPLVIDPELSYSTLLGGSGTDRAWDVTADSAGNVYVVGETASTNFPSVSASQPRVGGGVDVFLAKLRPDGKTLVYATYLGGSGDERGYGIATDAAGNVYLTGETSSRNFPTTAGAFQTAYGGGDTDAFLTKLNPTGSALLYSTLLGGSGGDGGNGVVVDSSGHAYLGGYAGSANFPTTPGAFQTVFGGVEDAFVARLNPAASGPPALVYSTFVGGNNGDSANAIALGPGGSPYLTGYTSSRNFPVTPGAYQRLNLSLTGTDDVFVVKLKPDASGLDWSSYFGGEADETGAGIAVDAAGNAYVAGVTDSRLLLPAAQNAAPFQRAFGGGASDAFVARFNPAASGPAALAWATYLGGAQGDDATRLAADPAGNCYVVGATESSNFPILGGAVQAAFSGSQERDDDAFLTKLSPAGVPVYSTFLGSRGINKSLGVSLDAAGNAYFVGATSALNFPVTPGVVQPAFGGGDRDAFIARINFAETAPEPRLAANGAVNAASFQAGGLAPGEITTFFGSSIGPPVLATLRLTAAGLVDTVLVETRVLFDNVAAPLIYVSANQVSAIVPYAAAGRSTTQVQVEYRGVKSPAVTVPVVAAAPGLFTIDSSGRGQGALLNQDLSVNSAANAAPRGSVVILFATGEGQSNPAGVDGKLTGEPLPRPVLPVAVTIGGQPATVLYAGGAPGLVAGVLQVNVRVPDGVTPGPAVPVVVTVGSAASQSGVTVAVR